MSHVGKNSVSCMRIDSKYQMSRVICLSVLCDKHCIYLGLT